MSILRGLLSGAGLVAGACCLPLLTGEASAQTAPSQASAGPSSAAPSRPSPPAATAAPKPPATPQRRPADPPPVAAQQPPAEPSAGGHLLAGVWKVYWLEENKSTELRIAQVFPGPNITNVIGAMANLSGEACPLTGSVFNTLRAPFTDGLQERSHEIASFATWRAQCPSGDVWIEAFGLPAGRILLSGRATVLLPTGGRAYTAVGLGR